MTSEDSTAGNDEIEQEFDYAQRLKSIGLSIEEGEYQLTEVYETAGSHTTPEELAAALDAEIEETKSKMVEQRVESEVEGTLFKQQTIRSMEGHSDRLGAYYLLMSAVTNILGAHDEQDLKEMLAALEKQIEATEA